MHHSAAQDPPKAKAKAKAKASPNKPAEDGNGGDGAALPDGKPAVWESWGSFVCVCDGVVLGRSLTHVLWHRSGNDTTYNIINNILQHHQV